MTMMAKKILILTIILLTNINAEAQTNILNQVKYWDFRETLKEKYVFIGDGKGKSIPAEYVDYTRSKIHWGDGNMALGWYIGVLATEYQLSSKKGYVQTGEGKSIDPKQTLIELSYALKAVDRLDLSSEPFFDPKLEPELNGFLIRDDVGEEVRSKFLEFKDISSDSKAEDPFDNEMSQDQTYELFIGLSLVKEFIPEKTQVGGVFIQQLAIDQAMRVLNQLSNNNWRLRNPAIMEEKGKLKKVKRGHQVFFFSKGINKIKEFFNPKEGGYPGVYSFYWSTLRTRLNPTYVSNSNASMVFSVSAVGNGFNKNTYRKLIKRTKKNDWYLYPLLNKALYPLNKDVKHPILSLSKAMLDEAPANGIKSNFNTKATHGWGVNNRFYKFKEYQRKGIWYQESREYNGLDYMLFYNLWLINSKGLYRNAWRLMGPKTRKEKRIARRAKEKFDKEEKERLGE